MSEYLDFERQPQPTNRKTPVVYVRSKRAHDTLGIIRWHGAWRQFVFEPIGCTIFSDGCLEDIRNQIQELMLERKVPKLAGA